MKDLLIARKIRRTIQKEVNNFFRDKLDECSGDIERLLNNKEAVKEIDDYLQAQEEQAITKLKEDFGINFHKFEFNTKRKIIRLVEDKIFEV